MNTPPLDDMPSLESHAPDRPATGIAPAVLGRRRRTSALIVFLLLALPAVYVILGWMSSREAGARGTPVVSQSGNAAAAISTLEARVKAAPTVGNRIDLSQAYIQGEMFGRAIELLTALLVEAPQNAVAWNNLCVARTLQMEYNLAIEACTSGIERDGAMPLLRNNLRWAEGERDKTIAALAEQEKTEPSKRDGAFYISEGLNQLHLGAYDDAVAAWRRSLTVDPKNAVAWNNIGTAQMMQHRYAEARTSFLQAKALDSSSELVRNNLAWADGALAGGR